MLPVHQFIHLGLILAAFLGLLNSLAPAQEPKKQPKPPVDEIAQLIDQLTQVDEQDIGYSGTVSGSAFLPLGQSHAGTMLLFQKPGKSSNTLKSLVKLGVKALPALLKHLDDDRPTKVAISSLHRGGMDITQDKEKEKRVPLDMEIPDIIPSERARPRDEYTVMVGDLCYVAIGQIVNRDYTAVRYQPSLLIYITSVPHSKKLREELHTEWSNLTPEKHRDSLARDLESGDRFLRDNASIRLAYYYPELLEKLALKYQVCRAGEGK